tara:strand:- start:1018 stop:1194 length:177 start_codon:yes stop_codon:yes gene_type:complete
MPLDPLIDQMLNNLIRSDQKRQAFEMLQAEMQQREMSQNERLRERIGNFPGRPWFESE